MIILIILEHPLCATPVLFQDSQSSLQPSVNLPLPASSPASMITYSFSCELTEHISQEFLNTFLP